MTTPDFPRAQVRSAGGPPVDATHTTSSPPRPSPRPDLVPDTPQGTGETTSSPVPLSYGGDEVSEPSAGRPDHLVPGPRPERRCRACGCTDNNACQNFLTGPCSWVEPDLCSACSMPKDTAS